MRKTLTINDYIITREGEVINKATGRKRKLQLNDKGYLRVQLSKKRRYFIHRLVAEKYIPNPENKPQVNHINGIKTDNRVENLEWCTNQENRNHAMKNGLHLCGEQCSWSKLTETQVKDIRKNKLNLNKSELALKYKISRSTIKDILLYKSWRNVK